MVVQRKPIRGRPDEVDIFLDRRESGLGVDRIRLAKLSGREKKILDEAVGPTVADDGGGRAAPSLTRRNDLLSLGVRGESGDPRIAREQAAGRVPTTRIRRSSVSITNWKRRAGSFGSGGSNDVTTGRLSAAVSDRNPGRFCEGLHLKAASSTAVSDRQRSKTSAGSQCHLLRR
jgi:hypothetical protein